MAAFAGASSSSSPGLRATPAANGRIRLVEVGLSWPPETFIMLKLRSLARRGVDVRVASFAGVVTPTPEPAGVKLDVVPELHGGRRALAGVVRDLLRPDISWVRAVLGRSRRRLPLRLWRLYLHLIRTRADVVHFEWLSVASTCLPMLHVWDGPVVVSCRGSDLPAGEDLASSAARSSLAGVVERADAVHVVSEANRVQALAHGLDVSDASLIRPAVDPQLFHPQRTEPDGDKMRFSVVSVGWLRWLKGYEYGLLAISELAREGIPVTLEILGGDPPSDMGEPSQRACILHTARDLGLGDRVRLHGNVSPREVCTHLQRADAFLHSSVSEGLPNVVVEAMACGVPPVATDVGGTNEAIRDGVDGFLTAPRDPAAAASALRRLWLDPDLRARMGRAARARVEAEFTIEHQTDRWLELYERIARDR